MTSPQPDSCSVVGPFRKKNLHNPTNPPTTNQELLSISDFPIAPEQLVEMAKDVLRAGGCVARVCVLNQIVYERGVRLCLRP